MTEMVHDTTVPKTQCVRQSHTNGEALFPMHPLFRGFTVWKINSSKTYD